MRNITDDQLSTVIVTGSHLMSYQSTDLPGPFGSFQRVIWPIKTPFHSLIDHRDTPTGNTDTRSSMSSVRALFASSQLYCNAELEQDFDGIHTDWVFWKRPKRVLD